MQIIKKFPEELTAADVYNLCMSPAAERMKEHVDEVIELSKYALYRDDNREAAEVGADDEATSTEVLSIMSAYGEIFATNSLTFIRDFFRMIDLFTSMGEQVQAIRIIKGTSKKGREFITCTLDH